MQLCQLLYFLGTLLPHSLGIRLHRGIQYLLMDTVGSTIGFSIPVVSTAHIFHTTLAIPAANHRNERIPAFLAGQQSRVTVLGLIAVCGASLLFEQALYLLPFLFSYDYGEESLMTIPVGFADEYGGTLGVVSMEDVLEQIVGDIWDESDVVEHEVVQREKSEYELDGAMILSDFLELVGLNEDDVDAESNTVGGWTLEMFGSFPQEGDSFTYRNLTVTVLSMDGRRVERVLVKLAPSEADKD